VAVHHQGRLVTLDGGLTISAVQGAAAKAPSSLSPVVVTRCCPVVTTPQLVERRTSTWTAPFAQGVDLVHQFTDVLGIAVVRPVVTETTALGAAYLAGLSCGLYPSTEALSELWKAERRFEPRINAVQAQEKMQRWERAVRQATAL
jgi:hypothetical protein